MHSLLYNLVATELLEPGTIIEFKHNCYVGPVLIVVALNSLPLGLMHLHAATVSCCLEASFQERVCGRCGRKP